MGSQRIMPVWIPSNLVKFRFPANPGARRLLPNVTQAIILMKNLTFFLKASLALQFQKVCSYQTLALGLNSVENLLTVPRNWCILPQPIAFYWKEKRMRIRILRGNQSWQKKNPFARIHAHYEIWRSPYTHLQEFVPIMRFEEVPTFPFCNRYLDRVEVGRLEMDFVERNNGCAGFKISSWELW